MNIEYMKVYLLDSEVNFLREKAFDIQISFLRFTSMQMHFPTCAQNSWFHNEAHKSDLF